MSEPGKELVPAGAENALAQLDQVELKTPEEFTQIIACVQGTVPEVIKEGVITKISKNTLGAFAEIFEDNQIEKTDEPKSDNKDKSVIGFGGHRLLSPNLKKSDEPALTFGSLAEIDWLPGELVVYFAEEINKLLKSVNRIVEQAQEDIEDGEDVDVEEINEKILKKIKKFFENNWQEISDLMIIKRLGKEKIALMNKALEEACKENSITLGTLYESFFHASLKKNKE